MTLSASINCLVEQLLPPLEDKQITLERNNKKYFLRIFLKLKFDPPNIKSVSKSKVCQNKKCAKIKSVSTLKMCQIKIMSK